MNISLLGEIGTIKQGTEILSSCFGFELAEGEKEINVKKCEKGFKVISNGEKAEIFYNEKNDFFRALSFAVDSLKNKKIINKEQKSSFEKCGIMLDVSRNAVLKLDSIKSFIRYMARMGLNQLMLYSEDVYELKNYPYFGYMRGRYSEEELKEIDGYAEIFGIEVIPCIQTLAHLGKALRWSAFSEITEIDNILFVGEEKTYEFIEEMIKTMRRCFKSDNIYIGMDEACNVGLGKYLEKHGYTNGYEVMSNHLKKVKEITDKYNYSPVMWSDMFFRLKNEDYYSLEPKLPENIEEIIPEGIGQAYWDYYHTSEEMYTVMVEAHKKMNREISFAGGVWTWGGPSAEYRSTFETTIPALKVCKKQGIKSVFATMWGDDGAECDVFQALYGLQLFAELNYSEEYNEDELKENFKICCDLSADAFWALDTEDFSGIEKFLHDDKHSYEGTHLSKQVLYNNPMYGLFDKNIALVDLKKHYGDLYKKLCDMDFSVEFKDMFECHKQLVKVLFEKCDLGIRTKKAYDEKDFSELSAVAEEYKQTANDVKVLYEKRKNLWYKNNKPFGFDQVGNRLAATERCLLLGAERIEDYVQKRVEILDELEQERLWYDDAEKLFSRCYFSRLSMEL